MYVPLDYPHDVVHLSWSYTDVLFTYEYVIKGDSYVRPFVRMALALFYGPLCISCFDDYLLSLHLPGWNLEHASV